MEKSEMELCMRRTLLAMLAFTALSTTAVAQKSNASQKAVFALEDGWTRALVKGDTAQFRRMLAPGFVYTEDNSVTIGASELIRGLASSTDKVTWAGNEGMKFYDYTPAGVVTGLLVVKGRNKQGEFTHRYRFTDTWLYRNGKWQIIAAQDYLIPK
jgi:hypothetical protein